MAGEPTERAQIVQQRFEFIAPVDDEFAFGNHLVVEHALAALTRFRVEFSHLEGPLQLCAHCSPGGLATHWTRDLKEYMVEQ